MLNQYIVLLTPPAGQGNGGSTGISTMVMFAAIAFIFYFMLYRPQKKRQKEREALISKMEKGDKVVTSSGIHGTISSIEEGTVLVQVADSTKLRFEKSAITTVTPKNTP
jgi:preprotein translocase subunit YajC